MDPGRGRGLVGSVLPWPTTARLGTPNGYTAEGQIDAAHRLAVGARRYPRPMVRVVALLLVALLLLPALVWAVKAVASWAG